MPRLSSALLLAVLALLTVSAVVAQSYVPQVPAWAPSNCPAGTQYVSVGNLDSSNSTLYPLNQQGTQLGTYWNPYYQSAIPTPLIPPSPLLDLLLCPVLPLIPSLPPSVSGMCTPPLSLTLPSGQCCRRCR